MRTQQANTILKLFICHLLFLGAGMGYGMAQDTTAVRADQKQRLGPVVVRQSKKPSPTLAQAPVQVVDIEKMERHGALLLSDAVRQMAGVTLRDYGGVGGMKTVSARGLGSQFSTLTIDGVAVNDAQNGQVDLGRYMLGGTAYVSLSNGQQDDLLLTARATAAGNVINMESREPEFMPGEKSHAALTMEGGSFGMWSPAVGWQQRLGKRTSMAFYGNYLRSRGDYPFTLFYTTSHNDSSSVERREHSAMWLATADLNIFHNISPSRTLTGKVHYVQGYHELPGPVSFYAQKGSEDTKEKLFFAQARYEAHSGKTSFQLIGKYQYTHDLYEDYQANTLSGYLSNRYSQNEGYLSGSALWRIGKGWTAAAATDAVATTLASSLKTNSSVQRLSSLSTATLQYRRGRFDFKTTLLATLVSEKACDNPSNTTYQRLSPYAGLSLRPFGKSRLRLRYFFKETYRIPNFNEMYYFVLPLDDGLRPECASQHNLGITMPLTELYSNDSASRVSWTFTADAYRNSIKDKIIAIPRQNMFIWSTMNLGLVDINGVDLSGELLWQRPSMSLALTVTYSFQQALDHTDPKNWKTYGHQIPYTPRHSGGATLYVQNRWLNVGYSCMLVGQRYSMQHNSDDTRLPAYAEHSITFDHTFELPTGDLAVQLQLRNLFDVQYEVVRSYPMMGRNFRIKATYSF